VQLTGLVLATIVVVALLHVSGATDADVGQPIATAEPVVVEPAPEADASAGVLDESAVAAPVVTPEPVNTSTPEPAAPTAVPPTALAPVPATRTSVPATRTPLRATATPVPEATSTPAPASSEVWVGNTGGSGVYVRKTPTVADRVRAYDDGTLLTIVGEDVTGDGQQWKHVRTPDGLEGYVPAVYVLDAAP
jgi:hypothetical protein